METRIAQMIEEEVERRVSERIGSILEYISKTYDVSIKQLMKDAALIHGESEVCLGLTAKNKRCGNKVCKKNKNGYCSKHQNQKPTIVRTISPIHKTEHTHPPNILFVKGCPGCKGKEHQTVLVDI